MLAGRKTPRLMPSKSVIQKNFIDDERQPVLLANPLQLPPLRLLCKVPRRVVRMHHRNRLRPRRHPRPQLRKINLPPVVVHQRIRHQPYIFDLRQKIEQRIARLSDQHLVARIAQQAEQPAVRFARAGRQKNPFRPGLRAPSRVIPAHRLARPRHSARLRIVDQRLAIPERRQNPRLVVRKAALCRIRRRQIEHRQPRSPPLPQSTRQPRLLHIPRRPRRKSHALIFSHARFAPTRNQPPAPS